MLDPFEHPIMFGVFMFGMIVLMIYGFGLAIMLLLSRIGDRPLRPIIAYSLTTIGALTWAIPSGQWWLILLVLMIGGACMAFHLFALIGRGIPDEPAPAEVWPDEDLDKDDDEPDSR